MDVGIRELKNRLSHYLAAVREGAEVVVTDRGRAVARLTSVDSERTLDRLVAEGIVTRARSSKRPAPTSRVRPTGSVSELVDEQRR